ncbi:MAG: nuclear transport factor 2 family protein [Acidimicrobiales bacterium]
MESIEVVDRYYERLANRDRSGLLELLSPDITIEYHAQTEHFPWAGTFHGIEGFDRFFTVIAEHLDVIDVVRDLAVSSEDTVVVPCRGHWRVRATATDVRGGMLNLFTVVDGRITRYEVYADTAAFLDAMST